MKNYKNNLFVFCFYLVISIFILRGVLLKDTFGVIYDWGYSLLNSNQFHGMYYAWSSSSNGSPAGLNTGFYWNIFVAIINYFLRSDLVAYKVLTILLFALMGQGIFFYLQKHKISFWVSILAGLFYMSSTFIITNFASGYFGFIISGALFPYLVLFLEKATESKLIWNKYLFLSIIISSFVFMQFHFVAFFFIVVLCHILLKWVWHDLTWQSVGTLLLVIIGYIVINIFWIITSFNVIEGQSFGGSFGSIAFLSRVYGMGQSFWSMALLSSNANAQLVIDVANRMSFRLCLMVLFLGIVFMSAVKNKKYSKFFLLYLLPLVLILPISVGANSPFSIIYPKLFEHIPGMSLFREAAHFQYLILLAYTVAFGVGLDFIFQKIKENNVLSRVVIICISIFLIIVFNYPAFQGNLFNYMGSVNLPADLRKTDQTISELSQERAFYPPNLDFWKLKSDSRIGANYPDQIADSFNNSSVTEASSDLNTRNLSWKLRDAAVNDFMTKDLSFLIMLPYLGSDVIVDRKYLDSYYFASVDMADKRLELRTRWMAESNEEKLKSYPTLKQTNVSSETSIYKLPESKGLVYLSSTPYDVCNYGEVDRGADSFFNNPAGQIIPFLSDKCTGQEELILNSENKLDFSKVNNWKHSADLGWSPGYLSFYESQGFSNEINDFAFTRVPDQFNFSIDATPSDQHLYAKYYTSPRAGEIRINDFSINAESDTEGWHVEKISQLDSQKDFIVKSISGENAIEFIGYLSEKDQIKTEVSTQKLGQSNLTYKNVNPTKYDISIDTKTTEPKLIILSENFNLGWKLKFGNREFSPILSNTYSNGFIIPGDINGRGSIEYVPQKKYRVLLILDCFLMGSLVLAAIYFHIRDRNRPRKKIM